MLSNHQLKGKHPNLKKQPTIKKTKNNRTDVGIHPSAKPQQDSMSVDAKGAVLE